MLPYLLLLKSHTIYCYVRALCGSNRSTHGTYSKKLWSIKMLDQSFQSNIHVAMSNTHTKAIQYYSQRERDFHLHGRWLLLTASPVLPGRLIAWLRMRYASDYYNKVTITKTCDAHNDVQFRMAQNARVSKVERGQAVEQHNAPGRNDIRQKSNCQSLMLTQFDDNGFTNFFFFSFILWVTDVSQFLSNTISNAQNWMNDWRPRAAQVAATAATVATIHSWNHNWSMNFSSVVGW